MITESQILDELKKINQQLSRQETGALKSFTNGFFHSFGYFMGTIVIFLMLFFFASRFDWTKALSKSFEKFMTQINWTNIVPVPRLEMPGYTQN